MEKLRGREALANYSFRDVVLKPAEAMNILTQKTRSVFENNMDNLIAEACMKPLNNSVLAEKLKKYREDMGQRARVGGLSMAGDYFPRLYIDYGHFTFKNLVMSSIREIFPAFFKEEDYPNNPENACVGYFLDLLRTLDPKVADFDDGVEVIVESVREVKFPLVGLGEMIDESSNLRGTKNIPFDPFADSEGAGQLKRAILRFINPDERQDFEAGLKNSNSGIWNPMGRSFN